VSVEVGDGRVYGDVVQVAQQQGSLSLLVTAAGSHGAGLHALRALNAAGFSPRAVATATSVGTDREEYLRAGFCAFVVGGDTRKVVAALKRDSSQPAVHALQL
jgi:hypothetical protein